MAKFNSLTIFFHLVLVHLPTSYYQISIGKDGFCLHEHPGMPVVEEVKHSISIDSNWFLCPSLSLLDGQLMETTLARPWDITSDRSWLGECQPTQLVV